MSEKLKPYLPHVAALAIFFVVSAIFFLPVFQGYRLKQGDIKNAQGMVQEARFYEDGHEGENVLWSTSMFSGMPTYLTSASLKGNVLSDAGVFFYGSLSPANIWLCYAISFYLLLIALRVRSSLAIVGSLAFAFSSYFVIIIMVGHLTKAIAVAIAPAILAGLVHLYRGRYATGTIITTIAFGLEIYATHIQVTYYFAMLFVIFVIAQLIEAVKEKQLPRFVKASAFALLSVIVGVAANFNGIYNTYEYGKSTTRGQSELTIQADGTSNKSIATTGLDKDYITAWSYGIQESWTILVPNAKGGATGAIGPDNKALDKADPQFRQNIGQGANHYWGDQGFTEGPVYVGAIICLLFVLGMIFLEGSLKWVMLAGAVLSLTLSWGKNFMPLTDFFLSYAPGYNKFRAVTIILVVLELCLPVVAILFVNELISKREQWQSKQKHLLIGGAAVTGILLLFWLMPASLFTFVSDAETQQLGQQASQDPNMAQTIQAYVNSLKDVRMAIFKADVMRSLFFVLVAFGLVIAYLKRGFNSAILIVSLGVLIVADQFTVDRRYLTITKTNGQFEQWEEARNNDYPYQPTNFDTEILQREMSGPQVMQLPGQENMVVQGTFASPQEISKQINERVEKRKSDKLAKHDPYLAVEGAELAAIQFGVLNQNSNYRVFNLTVSPFNDASTSYFHKSIGGYHGAKLKRYQELIEFHLSNPINPAVLNMLNAKYVITQQGLQVNAQACGNAWFVGKVKKVKNADEEIIALKDFQPENTVVIDNRYSALYKEVLRDSAATIKETAYSPEKLTYESSSRMDQLAVFSEIDFPGWKAYIDGKPVEHFRCNYVLRGLMVPAGKHKIEFIFEPQTVKTGETISMAGSATLILVIIGGIFFEIRRNRKKEQAV
ncbi:MAG: YfhO family protein [Bacteroidota bacterium]